MKLYFYGAAQEVGRSCMMVRSANATVLIDAGIKLGEKEEYPIIPDRLLKGVDAIFISHAHLDHSGYLPHIFSAGYTGKVYATKPTLELINVLISDYMHISDPKNVTKEGLAKMRKSCQIIEFGETVRIKDISIKPLLAGHILGSAMLLISDGKSSVLYTGDINLTKTRLLEAADTRDLAADTLITESTYGARHDVMPAEETTAKKMMLDIKETIIRGGKVVIPAFAVGRGQEVLLLLDDYMNSGALPKVPIYIDGMINKAMRIHRHNVIYCRTELQRKILMSDFDPFKSSNFVPVLTRQQRGKVASSESASIIVTTSGMLTGGPVIYYLRKLAGNPQNRLVLVGYQADGTPGKALVDGARVVRLENATVEVRMTVNNYHLSAHADRPHLEALIKSVKSLKTVFLIHGEKGKIEELGANIRNKFRVIAPSLGQEFDV